MKKIIFVAMLTVAFIAASPKKSAAQTQVSNKDFELWENVGSNTEEPNAWNGAKTGSGSLAGLAPKTLFRSSDVRPQSTGQYSARLLSVSSFGTVNIGMLSTGRINLGSTTPTNPTNYSYTVTSDNSFHSVMTDWPDSLVFWMKYTPLSTASQALVHATIHDNYQYRQPDASDANSPSHVVGQHGNEHDLGHLEKDLHSVQLQWARYRTSLYPA